MNIEFCDPAKCPIEKTCPVGPVPNLACPLKQKYIGQVTKYIGEMFPEAHKHAEVSLRTEFMLVPLFEQLLRLRIAEHANSEVIIGGKVNPLLKEIRQTLLTIDTMVSKIAENFKNRIATPGKGAGAGTPLDGMNYYEMLMHEGTAEVDERVGFKSLAEN